MCRDRSRFKFVGRSWVVVRNALGQSGELFEPCSNGKSAAKGVPAAL